MPVLEHDERATQVAVPAVNSGPRQPVDNAGSVVANAPLPAAFFDEVMTDVPVLAPALKPSRSTGWRIERFGAPGADGKGRYWQWRRGTGKARQSAYGGKV